MLWSDLERFGRYRDPWREFETLSNALSGRVSQTSDDFPQVNVWTSADHAVITTELPGLDPKDIDISVVDETLTLKGTRRIEEPKEGGSYHRRERWNGQFTKTVTLPFRIEAGKVAARYLKGILTIDVPRAETDKPRKIEISSK